jgi:hypothetical protein
MLVEIGAAVVTVNAVAKTTPRERALVNFMMNVGMLEKKMKLKGDTKDEG